MSRSAVKAVFGKKSLYEILEVERTASTAAIKKAYFRLALKFVSLIWRRAPFFHLMRLPSSSLMICVPRAAPR
jgi:hypothetical protein